MGEEPGQNMTHSGRFAKFDLNKINVVTTIRVEGEDQAYKLHIGGYRGTAGDSMTRDGLAGNNGMKFTTRDRDNDNGHCAKGGWWFNA